MNTAEALSIAKQVKNHYSAFAKIAEVLEGVEAAEGHVKELKKVEADLQTSNRVAAEAVRVLEASAAAQRKDLEADYATHAGVVKQVEEARATLADLDRERKEIIESTSEVVRAEVTRYQEEAKGQIKAIHAEVDAAVAKRDEILAEIEALRAKLGA